MTRSIQDTWNKFERWSHRYKKVCHKVIKEIIKYDSSDLDKGLFLQNSHEFHQDLGYYNSESELLTRISRKIDFLRGYLVDISFDGPEFMAQQSDFLTQQYPSRCDNSIGVWLEQSREGDIECGAYFGFQDFDVSFFCKSIKDVDLASMRNILPFDHIIVRRPKNQIWDKISVNNFVQQVNKDLEFDYTYTVEIHTHKNRPVRVFSMTFTWE